MAAILGSGVEMSRPGALDGLARSEINAIAPTGGAGPQHQAGHDDARAQSTA